MEGGAVGHNFEMGLPKDYPSQICFNLIQRFLKSSSLQLLGQMNRNLVGSIYGRSSINIAQFGHIR
jgi:hypothetical protein